MPSNLPASWAAGKAEPSMLSRCLPWPAFVAARGGSLAALGISWLHLWTNHRLDALSPGAVASLVVASPFVVQALSVALLEAAQCKPSLPAASHALRTGWLAGKKAVLACSLVGGVTIKVIPLMPQFFDLVQFGVDKIRALAGRRPARDLLSVGINTFTQTQAAQEQEDKNALPLLSESRAWLLARDRQRDPLACARIWLARPFNPRWTLDGQTPFVEWLGNLASMLADPQHASEVLLIQGIAQAAMQHLELSQAVPKAPARAVKARL